MLRHQYVGSFVSSADAAHALPSLQCHLGTGESLRDSESCSGHITKCPTHSHLRWAHILRCFVQVEWKMAAANAKVKDNRRLYCSRAQYKCDNKQEIYCYYFNMVALQSGIAGAVRYRAEFSTHDADTLRTIFDIIICVCACVCVCKQVSALRSEWSSCGLSRLMLFRSLHRSHNYSILPIEYTVNFPLFDLEGESMHELTTDSERQKATFVHSPSKH